MGQSVAGANAQHMPQLHAAFCIPEVLEGLPASDGLVVRALLRSLAHFELTADGELPAFDADRTPLAGLLAVALNLTCRGLPTRAPMAMSEAVLRAAWPSEVTSFASEGRGVGFELAPSSPDLQKMLVRALHVIDPRLTTRQFSEITRKVYPLDSWAEHRFLNEIVVQRLGPGLAQALLPQVPLDLLLQYSSDATGAVVKTLQTEAIKDSFAQHVDFALPLPYKIPNAPAGLVIEVDGPHHEEAGQKIKDRARVKAAQEAGWCTDRLPVTELDEPDGWLTNLMNQAEAHPYCQTLKLNYGEPLHATDAGRRAEQLLLSPVLAARVQRALLEAVAAGILSWDQPVWKIGIVEHDVPGGHLGARAFTDQLSNLFALEGAGRIAPTLNSVVYTTPEYANCCLHDGQTVLPLANYRPDPALDLLLDVAILARPGLVEPVASADGVARLMIRTSGMPLAARRIATAPLLRYADVSRPDSTDEYRHHPIPAAADALRFFLREIFRKADFRPGQLPILKRGLQGESVLGLLPTGGGKSLTYQLAGLLQPGVSLVVDPIKSLMQDQYEGLLANWIDAASFVNSSVLSTAEQRLASLTGGEVIFFFISPERLQIQGFRERLLRMTEGGGRRVGFGFCVVDEAHCVSEWGHDFRTQYLRLGVTARRFCRTHDHKEVPIYGLTATASFDVLADVQRELAMPDQDAIVRTRTTRRRELRFRVLPVSAVGKHDRIQDVLRDVPEELAGWSAEATALAEVEAAEYATNPDDIPLDYALPPKSLLQNYDPATFYTQNANDLFVHAGLIFCPHKSAKVLTGVESVLTMVRRFPGIRAGKFTAGGAEFGAPEAAIEAAEMMQTQRDFVNSRLNLLVATKAFGMGIDKPNVRFTVHYCYPGSIESLVQEAGRAGRDGAVALNYILFDPNDASINQSFLSRSFKGRRKEALMINELLTKVSLPATTHLERLRQLLEEEFDGSSFGPLTGGLWPKAEPNRLYVNKAFQQAYGYISLRSPRKLTADASGAHANIPRALAEAVMTRVISWLQEEAPPQALGSTSALVAWVRDEAASCTVPGVLPTLAAAAPDQEHPTLVIGFKNGEGSQIAARLGGAAEESTIWKAASFAKDGDEFANSLIREHGKATGARLHLTDDQHAYVSNRFEYLREEQDTYKAVHRLTLLGVVADYTLDYGAKTVTLHLNRQPADESSYTEAFTQYLRRYTTLSRAQELAAHAGRRERGQSLLEKVLGELLDFTYNEIADKRQRATKEMALACEKGVAEPDEDLGEFFDLYFNSKYARAEYLPEHTHGGTHFDRDLLWQYLGYVSNPPDGIGKERDNVKHLRGACARMLSSGADKNGAVLLLDAFAMLFLEAERKVAAPKILAVAAEKLLLGFGYYREQESLDDEDVLVFFDEYTARVDAIEPEVGDFLRQPLRELLVLDVNRHWLCEFNARFDDRSAAGSERVGSATI